MFYCEPCKIKNGWPGLVKISTGPCEVCGKLASCYDVPSRDLPPMPPETRDALDAARWRALVGVRRVRLLGYARGGPTGHDGPIRHIGFEFTTDGACPEGHAESLATLIEFVDAVRAAP